MSASLPSLRERQKQRTRDEIVRIAFDLFATHGFDEVSVEQICATAGISRATFFNYFQRKELILRDIAQARVARLEDILVRLSTMKTTPGFDGILELLIEMSAENTRISGHSKQLLVDLLLSNVTRDGMTAARERALTALTQFIERIPRRKAASPRLTAEVFFAIYMATNLEWFMRQDLPAEWLPASLRDRLQLVLEGTA